MRIDHEFTVSVPVDTAWSALTDLLAVSLCLPGARLTGIAGEVYNGEVSVRVGPVDSAFAGTARFVEKDDVDHRAVIEAKGRDSRGDGDAAALITLQLLARGSHTAVTVTTDLTISGEIAQLGGAMIQEVSDKLLGQLVECLQAKLVKPPPQPPHLSAPFGKGADDPSEVDEQADSTAGPADVRPTRAANIPVDLVALAGGAMVRRLVWALGVVALVALVFLIAR